MLVTVEGLITSIQVISRIKDDKEIVCTELLLAQPGEKMQVTVRLDGDKLNAHEIFERVTFSGQLLAWKTRESVGMMIMVRDQAS